MINNAIKYEIESSHTARIIYHAPNSIGIDSDLNTTEQERLNTENTLNCARYFP